MDHGHSAKDPDFSSNYNLFSKNTLIMDWVIVALSPKLKTFCKRPLRSRSAIDLRTEHTAQCICCSRDS